jgi:hypothetical protein
MVTSHATYNFQNWSSESAAAIKEKEDRQYAFRSRSQLKQHIPEAITKHLKMRVRILDLRNESPSLYLKHSTNEHSDGFAVYMRSHPCFYKIGTSTPDHVGIQPRGSEWPQLL